MKLQIPRWLAKLLHPFVIYINLVPFLTLPYKTWDVLMWLCGGEKKELMNWPNEISYHIRRFGPVALVTTHIILRGDPRFYHHLILVVLRHEFVIGHFEDVK